MSYPEINAGASQPDHPSNNPSPDSYKMAGDVVYPQQPLDTQFKAMLNQSKNESAMKDIAAKGPSAVDTTNLTVFKPK